MRHCCLLAILLSTLFLSRAAAAPNVLVLLADDLRASALRCYGERQVQTPHIDALAKRGLLMRNAYIMGGMQGAVCVPSRAMFLSGRSLFHVSEQLNQPEHTLLPECFRKAGYRDYTIGKWHNGAASFARACSAGDAIFFGGMSNQNRVPLHAFQANLKYPKDNAKIVERFSTELFVDAADKFLRETKHDRPFFLYVAFTSPHDPRTPPQKFAQMYDPEKMELPKNFLPEHPFDNGELKIRDEKLASFPRTPQEVQRHIADYFGMISHLDAEIGRLLATLQSIGQLENTIIVFAGDNGLAVGQHGLMGKQNVYEHSMNVPLIMAGPGIPVGRESTALCYLWDVYPTLCDLTHTPIPASVEGRSMLPVCKGAEQHRSEIFCAYRNVQRSVRNERYKWIEYPQVNRQQLFDLQQDPAEMQNLAEQPEQQARVKEMQGLLASQQQANDDPLSKERKKKN